MLDRSHWRTAIVLLSSIILLSLTLNNLGYAGEEIDTRRWSISYWQSLTERGLVPVNDIAPTPPAIYTESSVPDGPDVAVINAGNTTQSETSIFVSPLDNNVVLNSNNSTNWTGSTVTTLYGTSHFHSNDGGLTWPAPSSVNGPAGSNYGDPAAVIGLGGRQYIGYISLSFGMGVAYSTNSGSNWTGVNLPAGGSLDKNHLWIDNSPTSPYEGYVYNTWTQFSSPYGAIEVMRSTNDGVSWTSEVAISGAVSAGSHNQGVNLQTGPNGEVYACWAVYDQWASNQYAEDDIGFCWSTNGGASWQTAYRIPIPGNGNIKGIRGEGTNLSGSFPVRLATFPVMATDISGGPYNGRTYIVWTNIGVPGTNTGTNWDVYMTYSDDPGNSASWSTPAKVNGSTGTSRRTYYPWITCDPETGDISVAYYDNRNDPSPGSSHQIEVWVNNSTDGGATWSDEFKVSDVQFTPAPISGLAFGYMGDYIGINARGGKVYPVWADNRAGNVLTYVSAYDLEGGTGGGICDDITTFQARCNGSGTVQTRVLLNNSTIHAGESVEWEIDGTPYVVTLETNGTHTRAQLSVPGLGPGTYTV
ncbi:MAG: glycoside hydrolase, partial [Ignavibacteria bacterium]|nr:glycoside hydrolase [Ignavibacteria bacterium]